MINRISLNGCRYVASKDILEMYKYCIKKDINPKWIRERKRGKLKGYWYLRLWGRYKNTKESLNERR